MPNIVPSFYEHCNISPQIITVISLDVSLCLCWMPNMKNVRQVCSCRDLDELKFAGMDASELLLVSSNLSIMFGNTVFTEAS